MPEKNHDGVLSQLPPDKMYQLMGEVLSLLTVSPLHRQFTVLDVPAIILPPIHLNQFRIYKNTKGKAVGLVTWAYFSKEVEEKYLNGQMILPLEDWKSGDILYLTDFIAPYGDARKIARDLRNNIFSRDQTGKAVRFTSLGKRRKNIHVFRGRA